MILQAGGRRVWLRPLRAGEALPSIPAPFACLLWGAESPAEVEAELVRAGARRVVAGLDGASEEETVRRFLLTTDCVECLLLVSGEDRMAAERLMAATREALGAEAAYDAVRTGRPPLPDAAPMDDEGGLLRVAVDAGRADVLEQLLDRGMDPDARVDVGGGEESWGMPLYACVRRGDHEMAEVLLRHGADANGRVYASGTPLSEAYGQRDERMIALLIAYGGEPNASMAGLYRRMDLALALLEKHGDAVLPDDGFSSGTVAEQLLGAAAKGGDPAILRLAMERAGIPNGDPRWQRLLAAPLHFWNHWIGPWCHLEWDRGGYLECFRMVLEKCGEVDEAAVLGAIARMGSHVRAGERAAFAAAVVARRK